MASYLTPDRGDTAPDAVRIKPRPEQLNSRPAIFVAGRRPSPAARMDLPLDTPDHCPPLFNCIRGQDQERQNLIVRQQKGLFLNFVPRYAAKLKPRFRPDLARV